MKFFAKSFFVGLLVLSVATPVFASTPEYLGPPVKEGSLTVSTQAKSLVGSVGQYFSASFQVTGGTPTYTWQVESLPSGLIFDLELDASTDCAQPADSGAVCPSYSTGISGNVYGTPTTPGTFTAKFTVSDSAGRTGTGNFTFTISSTSQGQGLTITQPVSGAVWQLGQTYTITWTGPASLAGKPVNISLDPYYACLYTNPPCYVVQVAPYTIATNLPSTGSLTWTIPSSLASRYQGTVQIQVSTTDGSLSGRSAAFNIAGSTQNPIRNGFVDGVSASKVEGWAYDQLSQPSCVTVTYQSVAVLSNSFSAPQGFSQQVCPSVNRPDAEEWLRKSFGASLNIQQPLGFIANPSAVITTPGTYRLKAVTLSSGISLGFSNQAAQQSFVIGSSDSKLVITPGTLQGVVGQAVSTSLSVYGGNPPYAWTIVSGSLPDGLNLTFPTFNCITTPCTPPKDQAIVSGTPTKAGEFPFTVKVIDSTGLVGQSTFTFSVKDTNITPHGLTVTNPSSGEKWVAGKPYIVAWTPSTAGSTVTIELERYIGCLHNPVYICAIAQPPPFTITTTAPDTGSFSWTIPNNLATSFFGESIVRVTNNATGKSGESGVIKVDVGTTTDTTTIVPGMLVMVSGSGTVYYITPGMQKYGFISLSDFTSKGFRFDQVRKVDAASLANIPEIKTFERASGVSFKYRTGAAIYYLTANRCKEVYPSLVALRAWKVALGDIVIIPQTETYADCNPSFVQLPQNTLVRIATEQTIYVIKGGKKHPFVSFEAFIREGFNGKPVLVISRGELNLYAEGEVIK